MVRAGGSCDRNLLRETGLRLLQGDGHRARHIRENETITVDPVGVLGVEGHELVEQNVSHGGHAHGGTRVARVRLGGGINLEKSVSELIFPCSFEMQLASGANEAMMPCNCTWRTFAAYADIPREHGWC